MISYRNILEDLLDNAGVLRDDFKLVASNPNWLLALEGRELKNCSGKSVKLPEDFPWRITTGRNEMLLCMMSGDSSRKVSLFDEQLDLGEKAFEIIIKAMIKDGAMVSLDDYASEKIRKDNNAWFKELCSSRSMSSITVAQKMQILKEMQQRAKLVEDLKKKIFLVDKPYTSIEGLLIHLDMLRVERGAS